MVRTTTGGMPLITWRTRKYDNAREKTKRRNYCNT